MVVLAEPHALTLTSISQVRTADPEPRTEIERLRLSLGPQPSDEADVRRFVLEQVTRFLARLEAEITARNNPSPTNP